MGTIKNPSEGFPQVRLQAMHLLVGHQGGHLKYSELIPQARNQGLKNSPELKPHSWVLLLEPQAMHLFVCQHWSPQGSQLRRPDQIHHQVQI